MVKDFFSSKKIFFFSLITITFFISACNGNKIKKTDEGTLRSQAERKIKETLWTEAIEKDRLSKDINSVESIEKSIRLSPVVFLNSKISDQADKVYPEIEGFGSLDTSLSSLELLKLTREFCTHVCNRTSPDELLDKSSVYEYSLFLLTLKDNWKNAFGTDFPPLPETEQEEEKKQPVKPLFQSYILGQPFESGDLYEIPVRFKVNQNGIVDVMVFFFKQEEKWLINQLRIIKISAVEG